ncbi:MAG: alpha/beta hydrolase family protein [Methylocella sp.]
MAQGTEDRTSDAEMVRRLITRLTEAGRAPEAHFFEGEGHIFRAEARNQEWALLLDFFERQLSLSLPGP